MFRITRDPSSGSFIQCLSKITVMVLSWLDMDVVGVMAAYLPMVRVCTAQCRVALSTLYSTHTVPLYTVQYTHAPRANMLP